MTSMRTATLLLLLVLLPSTARAQQPDTMPAVQSLPRDVAREATELYNRPSTRRASGAVDVPKDSIVHADLAVLTGPLRVEGRVAGNVLAINSDVILQPTAHIDGDLLVVGGDVEGRDVAFVGGEIRIYRQSLHYTMDGEQIVASRDTAPDEDAWWRRWERRRSRNWSKLQVASAGAYNRVEGLPVDLGPQVQRITPWGRVRLDAYAVVRTSGSFGRGESDVGHNVHGEVQLGRRNGLAVGAELFNVVSGIESWQLTDLETGLASFLFHRDYRDYYERHGGNGYVTGFLRHGLSITGTFGEERWSSRDVHDPFTLFRDNAVWRPNPAVDEGLMHLGSLGLKLDTRNDPQHPASGWFAIADWERGAGTLLPPTLFVPPPPPGPGTPVPRHVDYSRAFLDVRRYNRISPDAQLNFRLVTGGWISGDALPLERRLSVDGPGVMPGYVFRADMPTNVGTCESAALATISPQALCDRIALAQAEYRGDLHFSIGDGGTDSQYRTTDGMSFETDGVWVLFLDAGRGWMVNGDPAVASPGDGMTYRSSQLPPLRTFRSDLGGGFDFGLFGVYAAKSLTSGEPLRFFVRLGHRF